MDLGLPGNWQSLLGEARHLPPEDAPPSTLPATAPCPRGTAAGAHQAERCLARPSPHPAWGAASTAVCLPAGSATVVSARGATGLLSGAPVLYWLQTPTKISPSSQFLSLITVSFDEHEFLNFSTAVKNKTCHLNRFSAHTQYC